MIFFLVFIATDPAPKKIIDLLFRVSAISENEVNPFLFIFIPYIEFCPFCGEELMTEEELDEWREEMWDEDEEE